MKSLEKSLDSQKNALCECCCKKGSISMFPPHPLVLHPPTHLLMEPLKASFYSAVEAVQVSIKICSLPL